MCQRCNQNECNGCSSNSATELANIGVELAEVKEQLEEVLAAIKPLTCALAHPEWLISHQDDIDQFDFGTGKGFDCWEGWAICDGQIHYSAKAKKNIATPNFTDRFIVMAGGTYAVGDTGGAATVALTIAEMPTHSHTVNDPQHTHVIDDPGHLHAIDDPGHTHGAAGDPHTHDFTTDSGGEHIHQSIGSMLTGPDDGSLSAPNLNAVGAAFSDHQAGGAHTHTGTTDAASGGVVVSDAFTGVQTLEAFTGITNDPASTGITIDDTGDGDPHENLPPYYAAIWVMKI